MLREFYVGGWRAFGWLRGEGGRGKKHRQREKKDGYRKGWRLMLEGWKGFCLSIGEGEGEGVCKAPNGFVGVCVGESVSSGTVVYASCLRPCTTCVYLAQNSSNPSFLNPAFTSSISLRAHFVVLFTVLRALCLPESDIFIVKKRRRFTE